LRKRGRESRGREGGNEEKKDRKREEIRGDKRR